MTLKILPSDVGPKKPQNCNYCNCDEVCVAYDLLGRQLELWKVAAGIYAAGMYRIACKHKTTGVLRDVGGVIDVGDQVIDFIPGNVIKVTDVEKDLPFKKYIVPALAFGTIAVFGLIIYALFFKRK